MTHIYDIARTKLALSEALSNGEVSALVKELEYTQRIAAYLAECHAATAESMPKSTSKANKERLVLICKIAALALNGDNSGIRDYNVRSTDSLKNAITRCQAVVTENATTNKVVAAIGNFL
jgi:hypothetical protein